MAIRSAKGSLFQLGGIGSPLDWDTLGQLRAFSQSGPTATIQETTAHDTGGNFMSKLATLLDPGTVSGPINYDSADATHQFSAGLWNYLVNLANIACRVVFAGNVGKLTFAGGYFSSLAFDFPVDNVLGANFEYTPSGAITASNTV